jgi:hypothetical protein
MISIRAGRSTVTVIGGNGISARTRVAMYGRSAEKSSAPVRSTAKAAGLMEMFGALGETCGRKSRN